MRITNNTAFREASSGFRKTGFTALQASPKPRFSDERKQEE
jgi:hypothetical protein